MLIRTQCYTNHKKPNKHEQSKQTWSTNNVYVDADKKRTGSCKERKK